MIQDPPARPKLAGLRAKSKSNCLGPLEKCTYLLVCSATLSVFRYFLINTSKPINSYVEQKYTCSVLSWQELAGYVAVYSILEFNYPQL